jgi:hypothetical protein
VPSDLEKMPHLLNFIRANGTLLPNDHTVLISHTAGGILSSLTGVYPDRHGQTVSNSSVRTSSTGGFSFLTSFGSWTDPVTNTPTVSNMITPTAQCPSAVGPLHPRGLRCRPSPLRTSCWKIPTANGDITKVFGNPHSKQRPMRPGAAQYPCNASEGKPDRLRRLRYPLRAGLCQPGAR